MWSKEEVDYYSSIFEVLSLSELSKPKLPLLNFTAQCSQIFKTILKFKFKVDSLGLPLALTL